jgi:hypothetical protein
MPFLGITLGMCNGIGRSVVSHACKAKLPFRLHFTSFLTSMCCSLCIFFRWRVLFAVPLRCGRHSVSNFVQNCVVTQTSFPHCQVFSFVVYGEGDLIVIFIGSSPANIILSDASIPKLLLVTCNREINKMPTVFNSLWHSFSGTRITKRWSKI